MLARARRALLAAALAALPALWASSASAYCRTTTCGKNQCTSAPDCEFCLQGGKSLFWSGRCISFGVQRDGSPLRGVDFDTARNIIGGAFAKWMSVDCGGGATPNLEMRDFGAINCARQEYNQTAGNSNTWMFRDDYWPYAGSSATLALTTITFNVKTGEIFDADVEVNAAQNPITIGDANIQADLDSIVTHEAGHFLGLSHSCDQQATMYKNYDLGEVGLRTLEPDDIAGICAIYPPGGTSTCSPTPRHGFSTECCNPRDECEGRAAPEGCCTTAPGSGGDSGRYALPLAACAFIICAARRRRKRRPS